MDLDTAQRQLLDTAEALFYDRGIQAVSMDSIRTVSGVSLKRTYQLFPTKERLVEAYLARRDVRWRARLTAHVENRHDPREQIVAVFDWLELWFAEPGFRGCAWINGYGELGAVSSAVAEQARNHKNAFATFLRTLTDAADLRPVVADYLFLLAEGAMVTAGLSRAVDPARHARDAARQLIDLPDHQTGAATPTPEYR